MSSDSPQPEFPPHGQPADAPATLDDGAHLMVAPAIPRANAGAALIAGILAVLTAVMIVWFGIYNIIEIYTTTYGWNSQVLLNVIVGAVGAGSLLVAAGFTMARRIAGAWTLCALCTLWVVAFIVGTPVLFGVPLSEQLDWVFGFDKANGVAIGLAVIFGVLTAVTALIAGILKSYESSAPPRG